MCAVSAPYDAQVRYATYHLVFVPMLRLPDDEFLGQIQSTEFLAMLESIRGAVPIPLMSEGLDLIEGYVDGLSEAGGKDHEVLVDTLARDRTYLFRALAPDVGAPPPYETQYRDKRVREASIGELADAYRAAGLEVSNAVHERPDYLGVELAFMARLIEAEAHAGMSDLDELRKNQASFYFDHVGRWAPHYASDALSHARTDFFVGLLKVAQALFERESTYLLAYTC